jgi:cytochrome c biogenesis protein CcmG, thiol:disulfide interchange protein DsbE
MRRLLAVMIVGMLLLSSPSSAAPKEGQAAPGFSVHLFDGSKRTLEDYRGQVVVINYWATWCAPCKAEMPMMSGFHSLYKKYGFEILGVVTRDSLPKRRLTELSDRISYPLVSRFYGKYGTIQGSVPTTYVIDRRGKLRHIKVGAFETQEFIDMMIPLLQEPA